MIEKTVKIGRKVFNTPFFVGSSDLVSTCKEAEELLKYGKGHLGCIIWKSTTMNPKEGDQIPRICDRIFSSKSELRNIGIDSTIKEMTAFANKYPNQSIMISLASVYFKNPVEEFEQMTIRIKNLPIDGIELNLSCPHQVANERFQTELLAQNAEMVGEVE